MCQAHQTLVCRQSAWPLLLPSLSGDSHCGVSRAHLTALSCTYTYQKPSHCPLPKEEGSILSPRAVQCIVFNVSFFDVLLNTDVSSYKSNCKLQNRHSKTSLLKMIFGFVETLNTNPIVSCKTNSGRHQFQKGFWDFFSKQKAHKIQGTSKRSSEWKVAKLSQTPAPAGLR